MMGGTEADVRSIESWHAHDNFTRESGDTAWALREAVAAHLGDRVAPGRFHEKPVGYARRSRLRFR